MVVLSLFDGISCGRVALDRVGIKPKLYLSSEINRHAIQVSMNNWADIRHLGDIKNIKNNANLPKIDLLLAGSPCQGFSDLNRVSGSGRNGFDHAGSKLFFEFVRILENFKPKYFLLENVFMKREWEDEITRHCFGIHPIKIDSAIFSAQHRKRNYWTNIMAPPLSVSKKNVFAVDIADPDHKHMFPGKVRSNGCDFKTKFPVLAKDGKHSCLTTYAGRSDHTLRHITGVPLWLDGEPRVENIRGLSVNEVERLQTLPDNYTRGISGPQRYIVLGNCWNVDTVAHILNGIVMYDRPRVEI